MFFGRGFKTGLVVPVPGSKGGLAEGYLICISGGDSSTEGKWHDFLKKNEEREEEESTARLRGYEVGIFCFIGKYFYTNPLMHVIETLNITAS